MKYIPLTDTELQTLVNVKDNLQFIRDRSRLRAGPEFINAYDETMRVLVEVIEQVKDNLFEEMPRIGYPYDDKPSRILDAIDHGTLSLTRMFTQMSINDRAMFDVTMKLYQRIFKAARVWMENIINAPSSNRPGREP